eukprot:2345920-Rhodomonas_salina.1
MSERKQVEKKKGESQPEEEEMPEKTPELEAAAVKIQARARGMSDRKQVEKKKGESQPAEPVEDVEEEEMPETTPELEAAA